jgi:hypothetical protein
MTKVSKTFSSDFQMLNLVSEVVNILRKFTFGQFCGSGSALDPFLIERPLILFLVVPLEAELAQVVITRSGHFADA